MSQSFFRDTYFGLLARTLSKGKYFPFPEQRPDFVIPSRYSFTGESTPLSHKSDGTPPIGDTSSNPEAVGNVPTKSAEGGHDLEKQLRQPIGVDDVAGKAGTATPPNVKLVDWYGPNDPDNPQNWSFNRKAFVTFQIW